jgi:hypothetical protein
LTLRLWGIRIIQPREGEASGDASGLQIRYGAIDVPGGFDSHTFPPIPYLILLSIFYDFNGVNITMLAV